MVRCLWYHVARDTSSRWLFCGGLTFDKRLAVSCLFCKKLATFYDENALSQRESLRFWLGYIPNSCLIVR
jgi:hypothetical protein